VLVAAAFTLRAIQVAFFGRANRHEAPSHRIEAELRTDDNVETTPALATPHHPYAPISWPEKAGALLLIAATVYIGLRPDFLLRWITPALESPMLQAILKGGTP
jgi:NADH-quinone oxidoreductase subunit M